VYTHHNHYWHGQISRRYKIIVVIIIVSNEYRNIAVRTMHGWVGGKRVGGLLRRSKYNSPREYIIIIMYKFLLPCGFETV